PSEASGRVIRSLSTGVASRLRKADAGAVNWKFVGGNCFAGPPKTQLPKRAVSLHTDCATLQRQCDNPDSSHKRPSQSNSDDVADLFSAAKRDAALGAMGGQSYYSHGYCAAGIRRPRLRLCRSQPK